MAIDVQRGWRPVLEGALADQAFEAIRSIATRLQTPPESNNASLAFGHAGLAVLYDYLPSALCGFDSRGLSDAYLDRAIEGVANQPLSASLFPGFTGVAWTIEHLRARRGEPPDEDANGEIDARLRALVRLSPWTGPYDLTRGLVGIAVYAVERLPRAMAADCLTGIIERFEELLEEGPEGVFWRTTGSFMTLTSPRECPKGYVDVGLAHGVPGVISILAAACRAGIASEKSRQMLDGGLRWLWAQRLGSQAPSIFPVMAASGLPAKPSRAAWCYGDPGVSAALVASAEATGDADLLQRATDVARHLARRTFEESGVVDAPLCHGAAGLGHIFNRLFHSTGRTEFANAAKEWFSRALGMRHAAKGIGGFQAAEKKPGGGLDWVDDPSVLTGAAGIALALFAAVSDVEPAWDRMLLLSLRSVES